MISSVLALSILTAFDPRSIEVFELPQCHETVAQGVWWPDLACARREFRKIDYELNSAWRKYVKSRIGSEKIYLARDQQNWVRSMNEWCGIYSKQNVIEFQEYNKLSCCFSFTRQRYLYILSL